jgi:DNA-binding transcriptional ArsR family regulator
VKATQQKAAQEQAERDEQLQKIDDSLMKKRRRAAGDATRLRIIRLIRGDRDWTAKELAEALGVGSNGLYYHLRVLEDAELITAGAGRPSPSGLEKTYQKSENLLVTHELNDDLILVYHSYMEVTKYECEQGVYRQIAAVRAGEPAPFIASAMPGFGTTAAEILEFHERLQQLLQEFRARALDLLAMQQDTDPPLKDLFFTYALVEKEPA